MSAMLHPLSCLLLLACNVPVQPDLAFPDQGEVAAAPMVAGPPALELPRHPALSPDGSKVAFAHQGDIWVADVADGMAMRLTAHDSLDARPSWSADGQELAFVSNRHGNFDVYLMPAWGGTPTRVTYDSESERLNEWIDGDRILVSATKERNYSRRGRGAWVAYRDGRTPTLLGDWPMQNPTLTADGGALVYERGHGDPSRRAYRGPASSELWVTDLASGEDRALTTFDGNDLQPMLAGDWVYFLSDRACPGNDAGRDLGLWRVPFRGGRPEMVFHPGGRSLRNADISADGGHAVAELDAGLVLIDLADGKARELRVHGSFDPSEPRFRERTVDGGASQLAVSPDGDSIAFVAAGDIYVMRHSDKIKRAVRVTTDPAPDGSPVWVEDGKAILFVSERDGNGELYKVRVAGEAAEDAEADGDQAEADGAEGDEESMPFYLARDFSLERMTETAEDESWPSLSPEGSLLAWVQGAGRLVVGDPETLAVSRTIADGFEAPSYDWAPDGRWVVYSQSDDDFNYDVFLARTVVEEGEEDLPGATPYNLTRHPDDDTGPSWSPDGRFITFTSRRMMNDESDVWMVYLQAADRERNERERLEAEEKEKKAKKKKDKPKKAEPAGDAAATDPLTGTWEGMATGPELPEQGLPFSMTLTLKDGAVEGDISSAMYTGPISQPSWDADAKVLTFTLDIPDSGGVPVTLRFDGDSCSGEATPPGELYQLSAKRTGTGGGDAAQDGGEEAEEEKKDEPKVDPVVIDWDELNRRIVRMTRREGNERAVGWGHDSKKIFFNASTGTRLTSGTTAETGFFSVAVEDRSDSRIESGTVGSFLTGEKGVYYVRGGRIIGNTGKATSYSFSVRYREDRRAVRKAVMEQGWRALDRNFYDPNFHGHDWAASLAKWQPLALAASTPEDYGEMVNWMLGEMNASHMGYWGFGSSSPDEVDVNRTGRLGVTWDGSHEGAGRRIAKVLPGGPAARSISRLEAGEVVLAVDGEEYLPGGNWARLMEGTTNRETVLLVRGADGAEREVVIRPTASIGGLLYRAQSEERRAKVEEASGGRLGYVHIEAMGTASLLDFERELFDAGHGKDALLIDVRENGGGWTTDMVLAMLMVQDHAITIPRGGGEGYPQGRRIFATWDKPVVVLCNENSYSNAEIFSWAIKTLGRGPIVGKQTYGAVISTGGAGLLDGSFVRMPFRGWYVNDAEKTNMEFMGCPPDYPVENLPADHAAGRDPQLDKAVEVGLGLLDG